MQSRKILGLNLYILRVTILLKFDIFEFYSIQCLRTINANEIPVNSHPECQIIEKD